jgi:hypothetical protein
MFTPESSSAISEEKSLDILNANSGASTWTMTIDNVAQGFRKYERADGGATAVYEFFINSASEKAGKSLTIRSWKSVTKKPSDSGF